MVDFTKLCLSVSESKPAVFRPVGDSKKSAVGGGIVRFGGTGTSGSADVIPASDVFGGHGGPHSIHQVFFGFRKFLTGQPALGVHLS